jgi:hypothetical protein
MRRRRFPATAYLLSHPLGSVPLVQRLAEGSQLVS